MATNKPTEAKEKMVTVRLPISKDHKEDVFVSVNERTWLIKRGVEVRIPECAAEVLKHSEDADTARFEYEDAVQSK